MADADTDIETPELVELQDEISKTSTEIVNELPADSGNDGGSDLLTEGQKKLPAALQEHILNSKKAESDEDEKPTDEMNVAQAIPDDDESPVESDTAGDEIFQNPVEQEPPAGEFHPPLDEKPEMSETDMKNKYAEVYSAHAMSQRVASMPLAEYEEWLFPAVGSPDHLRGQMCLARIEASLKAANGGRAVSDLWQIKIGAALWSRLNYREGNVEETRREVEKAPPMELMPLIPKNAAEAISVIEEMQASTIESGSNMNWPVLGACAAALIVPLVFLRRG